MIRFENVTFAYERGKPVIQSASFVIHRGETVGLIGANGAGKSTVMKGPGAGAPSQLFDGKILVDGLEVLPVNIARIRQKLGFVLQNSDNQMFMPTVLEDMMFGLLNSGMTRKEAEKKVDETLLSLGLMDLKYLSHGSQVSLQPQDFGRRKAHGGGRDRACHGAGGPAHG